MPAVEEEKDGGGIEPSLAAENCVQQPSPSLPVAKYDKQFRRRRSIDT